MLYIHENRCISPQQTFENADLSVLRASAGNQLRAIEPAYGNIPPATLRRMGKAARMGAGAAMPLLQQGKPEGIIIGTANGGMEESIRFLKQIIEYNEDMLAPGSFVQSTANAIASQLGMQTKNHGYNITHVHKGLAFENALIDASMQLSEHPSHNYLLGGVDEIASFNYRIEQRDGWYKEETCSNGSIYQTRSPGSLAGESAAMFLVNAKREHAVAEIKAISILHTKSISEASGVLTHFLHEQAVQPDLLLSGENGDSRFTELYDALENFIAPQTTIARYKHLCGEHPTASAFAVWLACQLAGKNEMPQHMLKRQGETLAWNNILICNSYQGLQHSFILVSAVK